MRFYIDQMLNTVMSNSFQHRILRSENIIHINHETLKQVQRDKLKNVRAVMLNLFQHLTQHSESEIHKLLFALANGLQKSPKMGFSPTRK